MKKQIILFWISISVFIKLNKKVNNYFQRFNNLFQYINNTEKMYIKNILSKIMKSNYISLKDKLNILKIEILIT